ncbi:hypothetical protein [Nocardioides convexus]|nr:hypothetical protein [Nocardioides convexus]
MIFSPDVNLPSQEGGGPPYTREPVVHPGRALRALRTRPAG